MNYTEKDCDENPPLKEVEISNNIYIGTKIVKAEPMTSDDFKRFKNQQIGLEENAHGYKVEYEDGYVSWSPKNVFERCYRKLSASELKMI